MLAAFPIDSLVEYSDRCRQDETPLPVARKLGGLSSADDIGGIAGPSGHAVACMYHQPLPFDVASRPARTS
eukprot:314346-Pyramimonas_sp.AAC.1